MKTNLTVDTIMEMVTAEAAGWGRFNCKWWMEKGTPVPDTWVNLLEDLTGIFNDEALMDIIHAYEDAYNAQYAKY